MCPNSLCRTQLLQFQFSLRCSSEPRAWSARYWASETLNYHFYLSLQHRQPQFLHPGLAPSLPPCHMCTLTCMYNPVTIRTRIGLCYDNQDWSPQNIQYCSPDAHHYPESAAIVRSTCDANVGRASASIVKQTPACWSCRCCILTSELQKVADIEWPKPRIHICVVHVLSLNRDGATRRGHCKIICIWL